MTWNDWRLRLKALAFRKQVEQDLDEELTFHLEMQERKYRESGMKPDEARRQAALQFGNGSVIKEECREERRVNFVETLIQDIRYALRGFRRTPLFALTVAATIGLGLGVNIALFTIFDNYVLRPLPVKDPYSLYEIIRTDRGHACTWPQYRELKEQDFGLADAFAERNLQVRINGHFMFAQLVTGNYFQALGRGAALGRLLTPADSTIPGARPVMVLSYLAWRNQFGGDPEILGKKVLVRGYPLEVIGVASDGFSGMAESPVDFWAPLSMSAQLEEGPDLFGQPAPERLEIIVRLKPGTSVPRIEAKLTNWMRRSSTGSVAGRVEGDKAHPVSLRPRATAALISPQAFLRLLPIFGAFALILAIACANVSNMMLARGMARQREIGIRLSIGAPRSRLIRQLLTESILLAFPGALAGFAIAQLTIRAGLAVMFATLPPEFAEFIRIAPMDPDPRVFGFMMIAAVLSSVIFGLAPALQVTRASVVQAARGDFENQFRPERLRNTLVVAQVAVCALLLICAGMLLRRTTQIHGLNYGMRTRDVLWIELMEKARTRIVARLANEPNVRTVASSTVVPLDSGFPSAHVSADGVHLSDSSYNYVSPEFFSVLDIRVKSGRNFSADEARAGAPVAIVSETLAGQLWPARNAVGQLLRFTNDPRSQWSTRIPFRYPEVRVIGVVRDIKTGFVDDEVGRRLVYLPTYAGAPSTILLLSASGDPEAARQRIDKALTEAAPGGVEQIHKMQELLAARVYPFRVSYWVSATLGVLALLLTFSGVYGVLAYLVEQRMKEIGLRMALGASLGSVVGLVMGQSMRLAAFGIGIGAMLALGASKLIASELLMMNAYDLSAYVGGIVTVLAACIAAAWVPSFRAARVDPLKTLRHD